MKKLLKLRALAVFLLLGCILVPTLFPQIAVAAGKKSSRTLKKGDSVWFGNYEQNGLDDGLEPIEWIVVEEKKDTVLLLSKYILDGIYYGKNNDDYSWKNSNARDYCNTTFYKKAFSKSEKKNIKSTKVTDKYGSTTDKVYIFSEKEIKSYFSSKDDKKYITTYVTPYAFNNGAFCYTNSFIKYEKDLKKYHGFGGWLERGPFVDEGRIIGISVVSPIGFFTYEENSADQKKGFRPVIVVKKNAVTRKDPYSKIGKDSKLNVYKNIDKKSGSNTDQYVAPEVFEVSGNKNVLISYDNYSYVETKKYVLFIDKGVSIRGNITEDIDYIIKKTEKELGLSLNLKDSFWNEKNGTFNSLSVRDLYFGGNRWKGINEDNKKLSIYVVGPRESQPAACCLGGEMIVIPYTEMDFYKSSTGISTFVHEIAHAIQSLNSPDLKVRGDKLAEGYAAYNEIKVYSTLNKFPINEDRLLSYESGVNLNINGDNAEEEFKKDYTEEYGESCIEEYQLGYALIKYMKEEYPDIDFNSFLEEVGKVLINSKKQSVTVEMEIKAIKKVYGKDFFEKFGEWFEKNYL